MWKLFSEIYFKFPVSSYWSWNFPHCTGSGINRGGVAYANGKCHKVSIPHSSILSKSRSTSQKNELHVVHANGKCHWTPSTMHGILSKSRSSVVRMGQSISVSVQLITKEMIPIHFFCKSNFLQMGWSVAKRAVWNNTFCMKSETMLKRLLPLVKLC